MKIYSLLSSFDELRLYGSNARKEPIIKLN